MAAPLSTLRFPEAPSRTKPSFISLKSVALSRTSKTTMATRCCTLQWSGPTSATIATEEGGAGGQTPLCDCQVAHHTSYDADVTVINRLGQSIIHLAIARMLNSLEEADTSKNTKKSIAHLPTPSFLQFVFEYSRARGLELGINQQTCDAKKTPLHTLLTRTGDDYDMSDEEGDSALEDEEDVFSRADEQKCAYQQRLVFITRLLLVNGADASLQDAQGRTPLHLAVDSVFYSKLLWKLLIENGGTPIDAVALRDYYEDVYGEEEGDVGDDLTALSNEVSTTHGSVCHQTVEAGDFDAAGALVCDDIRILSSVLRLLKKTLPSGLFTGKF